MASLTLTPLLGPVGAWFLFEGADGRSDRVEGEELAKAFSGTAVQAVVLSGLSVGQVGVRRSRFQLWRHAC